MSGALALAPVDTGDANRDLVCEPSIPCWYELSLDTSHLLFPLLRYRGTPVLILRIWWEMVEKRIKTLPADTPLISSYKTALRLYDWVPFPASFRGQFGFGGVIECLGDGGDFIELAIRFPVIVHSLAKCLNCNGSGKDVKAETICFHCDGTGKLSVHEWEVVDNVAATLSIILDALQLAPSGDACSQKPQLLTVLVGPSMAETSACLDGRFSVPLVQWLTGLGQGFKMEKVVEAMNRVHSYMFGMSVDSHYFDVHVADDKGWLGISCPGDRFGLCPNSAGWRASGSGYQFVSYDIANPGQQLTLLAGLAALCDEARGAMK